MPELLVTVEFGMYGANSKPLVGARWRASFYDSARGQFYAGSADDPFEAIAWALFEREERIANDEHPTPTKASNETPVQALARLRARTHGGTAALQPEPQEPERIARAVPRSAGAAAAAVEHRAAHRKGARRERSTRR